MDKSCSSSQTNGTEEKEVKQEWLLRTPRARKCKKDRSEAKRPKIEVKEEEEEKDQEEIDQKPEIYDGIYKIENLADLPDVTDFSKCEDVDKAAVVFNFGSVGDAGKLTEEDMDRLLKEINLPLENILKLATANGNDVEKTIKKAQDFVVPTMVQRFMKDFVAANMVVKGRGKNQKTVLNPNFKDYYFNQMTACGVEKKYLVENYTDIKNNIEVKWTAKTEETDMTSKERKKLEKKMKKFKISIIDEKAEREEQERQKKAEQQEKRRQKAAEKRAKKKKESDEGDQEEVKEDEKQPC